MRQHKTLHMFHVYHALKPGDERHLGTYPSTSERGAKMLASKEHRIPMNELTTVALPMPKKEQENTHDDMAH